jgi:hypothetical protein
MEKLLYKSPTLYWEHQRKPSARAQQQSLVSQLNKMDQYGGHHHNLKTYYRGSAVGIVTGYGLHDESRYGQEFLLLHFVQIGSGAHQHPIQLVPGVQRQGREADHSPPANAEVKKM